MDDFFRGGDAGDGGVAGEGGAGAAEADAEEDAGGGQVDVICAEAEEFLAVEANFEGGTGVAGGGKPGLKGGGVEVEADVGGFGDVAVESGGFYGGRI